MRNRLQDLSIAGLTRCHTGLLIFRSRGWDEAIDPLSPNFPVNYCYEGEASAFVQVLGQILPLAIFGALHAIAWSAAFPSPAEQFLWRASSIAPAILAFILLTFFLASYCLPNVRFGDLEVIVMIVIIPPCFAARLAFIVLPLFQLRDIPPLAYQTVPWSDFLPHV